MTRTQLINGFSMLLTTGMMAVLVIMLLVSFWPIQPLEVKNQPIPVTTPVVKAGDAVTFISDYCKNTDAQGIYSVEFVGEVIYPTPERVANAPEGCRTINLRVEVPKDLPAGKYTARINVHYDVNQLRRVYYTITTQEFVVDSPDISDSQILRDIRDILTQWELVPKGELNENTNY